MTEQIVYVNGHFLPAKDAKISIFDRGLLFADSIYEVIPVYEGQVFFLEKHLRRLQKSLEKIKMRVPEYNWKKLFQELIMQNGSGNMQIYVQLTRGCEDIRRHDIPEDIEPTIIIFTLNNPFTTTTAITSGLHAICLDDYRWQHCDIKTTALLANVLLNDDAIQQGGQTALLFREGYLTEGSASNIFLVDNSGVLNTPPLSNFCLAGITREVVLELAAAKGWPLCERPLQRSDILNAKELWLTSTTKEIYPITKVDSQTIGSGKPGLFWQKALMEYKRLIKDMLHG